MRGQKSLPPLHLISQIEIKRYRHGVHRYSALVCSYPKTLNLFTGSYPIRDGSLREAHHHEGACHKYQQTGLTGKQTGQSPSGKFGNSLPGLKKPEERARHRSYPQTVYFEPHALTSNHFFCKKDLREQFPVNNRMREANTICKLYHAGPSINLSSSPYDLNPDVRHKIGEESFEHRIRQRPWEKRTPVNRSLMHSSHCLLFNMHTAVWKKRKCRHWAVAFYRIFINNLDPQSLICRLGPNIFDDRPNGQTGRTVMVIEKTLGSLERGVNLQAALSIKPEAPWLAIISGWSSNSRLKEAPLQAGQPASFLAQILLRHVLI